MKSLYISRRSFIKSVGLAAMAGMEGEFFKLCGLSLSCPFDATDFQEQKIKLHWAKWG